MWATLLRCPHVHSLGAYWPPVLRSLRKRKNFLQVESKERCCSSDPREMRGPPSSSRTASTIWSVGRFLSRESSCSFEMISPPRVHRLSRCDRSVLRDWPELTRWRKNGLKHSTISWPCDRSRSSYIQLLGHCSRSGQYAVRLICGRSLGYWGGVRCGLCFGFCAHAADHPPQPLPALSRLRLREGTALSGQQHHRDSR